MGAIIYFYVFLGIICGVAVTLGIMCFSIVKSNDIGDTTTKTEDVESSSVLYDSGTGHDILFF